MKYIYILNYIFVPVVVAFFAGALADGLQQEPEYYYQDPSGEWEPSVNPYVVAMIAYPVALLGIHLLIRGADKKRKSEHEAFEFEEKRLQKLRASMTPAEWANYEVQLDIQKQLQAIKRNASAPRRSYGIFTEPFE